MSLSLYVVFDSVAEAVHGPLMALPNDAVARRTFQDALTDSRSVYASHPADFTLCRIGEYDTKTGYITPCHPEEIINGQVIIDLVTRNAQKGEG